MGSTTVDAYTRERPGQRWRRLLQRKLLRQVTLPTLIGLIQLALAVIDLSQSQLSATLLVWLVVALAVGWCFGRAIRVVWDRDTVQVILVGGQVLLTLAYLVVSVGSRIVLNRTLGDLDATGVTILLVASGLMLGRTLGMLRQIREALQQQEVAAG